MGNEKWEVRGEKWEIIEPILAVFITFFIPLHNL